MIVGDKDKMDTKKRGLGRGLSALFDDDETSSGFVETAPRPDGVAKAEAAGPRRTLGVDQLTPSKFQPRQSIDEAGLKDLAASIAEHGVLQPIIVRALPDNENKFQIIAGERRWRAAQMARLHEVPVTIKTLTNTQAMEIALIENLQREDLDVMEEAYAYDRLMHEFGHTQEKLSIAVGKSRSYVANVLRMLDLPPEVREMLDDKRLSMSHARALLASAEPLALAQKIIAEGLSVRETERLASREPKARGAAQRPGGKIAAEKKAKDVDTVALEKNLSDTLGLRVAVDMKSGGAGTMKIEFKNLDQLDEVIKRLSGGRS